MNARSYCGSMSIQWGAVLSLCLASSVVHTQEEIAYPIVLASNEELPALGIGFGAGFRNKCYYYGDGGYMLSVSDPFLERYRKNGFSLNSLCMALVSGIRFDPEAGARLPTYVVADLEALEDPEASQDVGVVSPELPLAIPRCFGRGLPYSDCKLNFHPLTGKRLSAVEGEALRRTGASVGKLLVNAIKSGGYTQQCRCPGDEEEEEGACRRETWGTCEGLGSAGAFLAPEYVERDDFWDIGFFDVSASLPMGYGYALYADGGAGPSADPAAVQAARDGKKRATEASIRDLRNVLEGEDARDSEDVRESD